MNNKLLDEEKPHPQTGDTTLEQAKELLFKGAKQCSRF